MYAFIFKFYLCVVFLLICFVKPSSPRSISTRIPRKSFKYSNSRAENARLFLLAKYFFYVLLLIKLWKSIQHWLTRVIFYDKSTSSHTWVPRLN